MSIQSHLMQGNICVTETSQTDLTRFMHELADKLASFIERHLLNNYKHYQKSPRQHIN